MVVRKNGNRRVGASPMGCAPSTAVSERISGALAVDVDRIIKDTCRGFARVADWRRVSHVPPWSGDHGAADYRLSEDHEGLHSGRYISVSIMRAANALAIKGGYYDGYRQPRTVYSESVPLKEVTSQSLGCLLMEIHDRLCSDDRSQAI